MEVTRIGGSGWRGKWEIEGKEEKVKERDGDLLKDVCPSSALGTHINS